MPDSIDIDADPFLKLLTDALRAGPGSPEWHQAVSKLKAGGHSNADEFQLLVKAREHLESGRSYRAVRAGPGFTRKLLSGIDAESTSARPALPTANLVAVIGAIVVLGVLGLIGYWLLHSGNATPAEDLSNTYFGTTIAATNFDGPLPSQWQTIGPLALDTGKGLRPAPGPVIKLPSPDYVGGGVALTTGIPFDQPFAIEATIRFGHVSDDVIPQLFVTDQPDYSPDRATSPHELVWLVREGKSQIVLPDGQITGATAKITDGQTITVRIIVGQQTAQVVSGGNTQWTGQNQLAARPRYAGIRFLRRGSDKRDAVVVGGVKVLEK
jgi:hypothetical protein